MSKVIRGHTDIHALTRWCPRAGEPDVQELVIVEFRIEHRDGLVEGALTAAEALAKVSANLEQTRRRFERKYPSVERIWITTLTWHNVPVGFEPPAMEVRS